jgi:2-polyprenyl-6-methoxyphenol hydroxylase-like FAD-dependent oxidoreductase
MKVLVIGGGIGGFATALSLHAVGIECEVFEQARGIRELGVGMNILPHATRELAVLGLLEALDRVAIRTCELIYANRFGQEIWREPRGLEAGYAYPQLSIHRGTLQGALYASTRERIGEDNIRTAHQLVEVEQDVGVSPRGFCDATTRMRLSLPAATRSSRPTVFTQPCAARYTRTRDRRAGMG